ncbi:Fic/DOC family protein [Leucobacter ruminantium]|uniref:protein adenylyltransferase n=1 Tax=Leucobacter ruminantium TaxID=1289170 RepID=A0A939LXG2_9MICO|nr:Fic family protein [Leucobacter ruminantium]MBO1806609.1 Fic family protein [Leucobacter ruminantium]
MASPDFVDPYLDPELGLLRNLVGARTRDELDAAEGSLAFARLLEMLDHPVDATGDLAELRSIHRRLFQDVYDWAGDLRTVDIRKPGSEFFLPVPMIDRAAAFAAAELQADDRLKHLSRDRFIDRLSYHYDQWNYLHPFREGNGRTQRVFWSRIAHDAGWQLDWLNVRGPVNDEACRAASEDRNLEPLRSMFTAIVTQSTPDGHADTAREAERITGLAFPSEPTSLGAAPQEVEPRAHEHTRSAKRGLEL